MFGELITRFLGLETDSPAEVSIRPENLIAKKPVALPPQKFAELAHRLPVSQIFLRLGPAAREVTSSIGRQFEWDITDGRIFRMTVADFRLPSSFLTIVTPTPTGPERDMGRFNKKAVMEQARIVELRFLENLTAGEEIVGMYRESKDFLDRAKNGLINGPTRERINAAILTRGELPYEVPQLFSAIALLHMYLQGWESEERFNADFESIIGTPLKD